MIEKENSILILHLESFHHFWLIGKNVISYHVADKNTKTKLRTEGKNNKNRKSLQNSNLYY
jgi:hypothetical protein